MPNGAFRTMCPRSRASASTGRTRYPRVSFRRFAPSFQIQASMQAMSSRLLAFRAGQNKLRKAENARLVDWQQFLAIFAPDGPPIGSELRASAEIVTGHIEFHGPDGTAMPWMTNTIITSGSIRRRSTGGLDVAVQTRVPLPALQAVNEQWVLADSVFRAPKRLCLRTRSCRLIDRHNRIHDAAGHARTPSDDGQKLTIPFGTTTKLDVGATCILDGSQLRGTWSTAVEMNGSRLPIRLTGSFALRVV